MRACALVLACATLACDGEIGDRTHDAGGSGAGAPATTGAGEGGSASQGGAASGGAGNVGAGTSGPASSGSGGSPNPSGSGGSTSGSGGSPSGTGGAPPAGCTPSGLELIDEVNAYRAQNGLPAIPASTSMCIVSETHVGDLATNAPQSEPGCNLHSWSDQGSWTGCCYTPDHAEAECMWVKPSELSAYPGSGYEIAASGVNTASGAVGLWAGSAGHNAVMLNEGSWPLWGAMGAAIGQGYAVVWFGEQADPMP